MKIARSFCTTASAALLALGAMAVTTAARASDVFWSVGVQAVPGVHIGVSNAPRIYSAPQPIYVQPAPAYVPQPIYYGQAAPVYSYPAPVYVRPAPIFVRPAPVYSTGWSQYPGPRHHGGPRGHHGPRGHGR